MKICVLELSYHQSISMNCGKVAHTCNLSTWEVDAGGSGSHL